MAPGLFLHNIIIQNYIMLALLAHILLVTNVTLMICFSAIDMVTGLVSERPQAVKRFPWEDVVV
jgi:Tol biopolymer transport system component